MLFYFCFLVNVRLCKLQNLVIPVSFTHLQGLSGAGTCFRIYNKLIAHIWFELGGVTQDNPIRPQTDILQLGVSCITQRFTIMMGNGGPDVMAPLNFMLIGDKLRLDSHTIWGANRFDITIIADILY